jgi:hypothetical protein
MERQY